jgi:hypothetical protein
MLQILVGISLKSFVAKRGMRLTSKTKKRKRKKMIRKKEKKKRKMRIKLAHVLTKKFPSLNKERDVF